jgi:uncharacterized protein YqeY
LRDVRAVKDLLRTALREALRARQPEAVAAFREVLAALDNAEAADVSAAPPVQAGVIAGGVEGLGAGEVPRRVLSPETVAAIVAREIRERREAAAAYAALGQPDEARRLSGQVEALVALLS